MLLLLIASLNSAAPTNNTDLVQLAASDIQKSVKAEDFKGLASGVRISFLHDYRMDNDTLEDTEDRLKGCKIRSIEASKNPSVYTVKWNCPVEAARNTFTSIITVNDGQISQISSSDAPIVTVRQ